jgi:hypothetical protein
MFTAFTTGGPNGIDITDWPMFPSDIPTLCNGAVNPDFFCSSQTDQLGIFDLQINHHKPLLGVAQLAPRTTLAVGVSLTGTAAGCSVGFGALTVTLENQEQGNAVITDPFNSMTMTNLPSGAPMATASGPGTYIFPCILAGSYLLTNSAYANCPANPPCTISIGSGTANTATFFSNYNSPSTFKLAQPGIYFRQAIAHLLDKPKFASGVIGPTGVCKDIFASAAQGFTSGFCNSAVAGTGPLPASVLNDECSALTSSENGQGIPAALQISTANGNCNHPNAPGTDPTSYLLGENPIGAGTVWWATGAAASGYPSAIDIRAACDLLVLAGFPVTPGNSCIDVANGAQGGVVPTSYPHNILPANQQLVFYIRTDPPRKAFGQIIADGLNLIFGTANNGAHPGGGNPSGAATCAVNYGGAPPACTPVFYGITGVAPIIFGDGLSLDTWNLYTGGFSFAATPDNLYGLGNSLFASGACGGAVVQFPSNYVFECDPIVDTFVNNGEHGGLALPQSLSVFQTASEYATQTVYDVPVYNLILRFVALNCLNFAGGFEASLVNGFGTGWLAGTTGSYFTYLNAHKNVGNPPVNPAYACGGGNDSTLRVGQSQDSDNFSPYQATSIWDFNVINEIYDSMLAPNPDTGGASLQLINWMVTTHTSTFNPAEISCSPGAGVPSCVSGTTTQVWKLRPDLLFHDGTPVTSDDVCFSILTYRDVPAALLQPAVINVASCRTLNASTIQVKLTLFGTYYDNLIGGVPILPHHVWEAACNWPVGTPEPSMAMLAASQCANPAFDPMTSGLMIGSGPYECLAVAGTPTPGTPGGPCSLTAAGVPGGSSNTLGGKLFLTAFRGYHRGLVADQASKYEKFSWADKFDTGIVTIADIADAALHFRNYDPYWASPLFSSGPANCLPLTTSFGAKDSLGNPAGAHTANGIQVTGPGTFTFTAGTSEPTGVGAAFAYSWNFGDGSPLGGGNPVLHTFAAGQFLVSETVTDNLGLAGSTTPGTGALQCVGIGDIATVALYKGTGATDPTPFGLATGLDPHIDRFDGGVAPVSGAYYLGGSGATTGSTSIRFSTFSFYQGLTNFITGVTVIGTTGPATTAAAACTATSGTPTVPDGPNGPGIFPDGPGRTTFICTFGVALAPDMNGQTEVEITLTFTNGVSTEIEMGS